MNIINLQRSALLRLAIALPLLATVIGAVDWWLETERVNQEVVKLAAQEANRFAQQHLPDQKAFGQPEAELRAAVIDRLHGTFPIVELYDAAQRKAFEFIAPGREAVGEALKQRRHGFPDSAKPIYEKINLPEGIFVQVLLPLRQGDRVYGYFEGVYDVPAEVEANIREDITRSVLMICFAVVVTGVVLYPLLMALNRDLVRASRGILRGNLELLEVLGSAVTKRDGETNAHNHRVTWYAIKLAKEVGVSASEFRGLIAGAFLHDVGKIGVPDGILLKAARLDAEEFATMKQHVAIGADIIAKARWLGEARDVIEYHHEKWDGTGYLRGLRGEDIPLAARIFAIVDVFDALISRRPYKEPMLLEHVLEHIQSEAGRHFDPALVLAFARIARDVFAGVIGMSQDELERELIATVQDYYGSENVSRST